MRAAAPIAAETLLYAVVIRPVKNESGRNTAGEHALITITDSTGGGFFILDELNQLDAIFDRINRELRTQYLLGYYPQSDAAAWQPPARAAEGEEREAGPLPQGIFHRRRPEMRPSLATSSRQASSEAAQSALECGGLTPLLPSRAQENLPTRPRLASVACLSPRPNSVQIFSTPPIISNSQ